MAKQGVGLILAMVVISLVLCHASGLSREGYQETKKPVKSLNRPSVIKSMQTEHGDIFDCVDIKKQPTLDHPLLKNHKIEMEPEFVPEGMKVTPSNRNLQVELKIEGCPHGTVPIRRTKMADGLLRDDYLSSFGKFRVDVNVGLKTGTHYATLQQTGTIYGAQGSFNVWNPQIKGGDASFGMLFLASDSGDKQNGILAGWHVYPRLYGDSRTRLFGAWTADGFGKTGCYNNACSGFVQVSRNVPLGIAFRYTSIISGTQIDIEVTVVKSLGSGNWWLKVDDNWVGYWPNEIFTTMADNAEAVQWGGYVGKSSSDATPMGSGRFAIEGYRQASYIRKVMILDSERSDRKLLDAIEGSFKADVSRCYSSGYGSSNIPDNGQWGRYFFYGGPGTCS